MSQDFWALRECATIKQYFHLNNDAEAAETTPRSIDLKAGYRAFIQTLGLGIGGAALFGMDASQPATAQSISDADIFNFATNFEYLEAEFCLSASVGNGLADAEVSGRGTLGPVAGGRSVPFQTQAIANYTNEIARYERLHVNTLCAALGNNAVARPSIDLGLAFTIAARAAELAGLNDTFDAFANETNFLLAAFIFEDVGVTANETNFLLAAFIFEDVGVTAYHGAAPLITDPRNLSGAASILAIEAYHAGTIHTVLYSRGLFSQTQAISDARDSPHGGDDLDQGLVTGRRPTLLQWTRLA